MNLSEAIIGRRSVREYTEQPIDTATINRLIDSAIHAPNAVNQQPWRFTVVRDRDLLDHISRGATAHMQATMEGNPHADHFRIRLSDPHFHVFYHAPALVLISAVAEGPWIVEDCALAAATLMLASYALGLGSCWIGFAQGYLNTREGKRILNLPAACVPVAPIILGHPKVMPPPVPRNAPEIRWLD